MSQATVSGKVGEGGDSEPGLDGEGLFRGSREDLAEIARLIDQGAELLPPQGPISAFAFLNTLQGLEHLPFDEGMRLGSQLYGCQPYLVEERYRTKLAMGRITDTDLQAVVDDLLKTRGAEKVFGETTRRELRLAMLRFPLRTGPAEELRWYVAETGALKKFRPEMPQEVREEFLKSTREWVLGELVPNLEMKESGRPMDPRAAREVELLGDLVGRFDASRVEEWSESTWEQFSLQALWRVCRDGVLRSSLPPRTAAPMYRHRDLLLARTGVDPDRMVNELLIRFCAPFTDQGFADWALPNREAGFFSAFSHYYRTAGRNPARWLRGLGKELERVEGGHLSPLESIHDSLARLGVPREEWGEYLTRTLLALRGWAGMLRQMEVRGDRVPYPVPAGTTIEYMSARLILDRLAAEQVARRHPDLKGDLGELKRRLTSEGGGRHRFTTEERAFDLFQLAQLLGWTPHELYENEAEGWGKLEGELRSFASVDRRHAFHLAFERNYHQRALEAFEIHAELKLKPPTQPKFQAVFCIDAREESFRRHLETVCPEVQTFGLAGFFGVPVYYKGLADAHFSTLCPIVVRPKHWLVEDVILNLETSHRRRSQTRRVIGEASRNVHFGSRSFAGGGDPDGDIGGAGIVSAGGAGAVSADDVFDPKDVPASGAATAVHAIAIGANLRASRSGGEPDRISVARNGGHRKTDAAGPGADAEFFPAGDVHRARIGVFEQSAQIGIRLRGLFGMRWGAERACSGGDFERLPGAPDSLAGRDQYSGHDGVRGCPAQYLPGRGDLFGSGIDTSFTFSRFRVRSGRAGGGLRIERAGAVPQVPVGPVEFDAVRGEETCGGTSGGSGTDAAGIRERDERAVLRGTSRADAGVVHGSPKFPDVLRSVARRPGMPHLGADPGGGGAGMHRDQHAVFFVERGFGGIRFGNETAA